MKAVTCIKCVLFFYLVLNCTVGLGVGVFVSFLLLSQREIFAFKPKIVAFYFLLIPPLLVFLTTVLGWSALKRNSIKLLKLFAVLLAATVVLEIAGCLWWFSTLPQVNNQVLTSMKEKFAAEMKNSFDQTWWDNVQAKLKCCGVYGHNDYQSKRVVPISCCGSDLEDNTKGSCSFFWQKGCATVLTNELSLSMNLLSAAVLCAAFLQIPGVFISWWFANKMKLTQTKSAKMKTPTPDEQMRFIMKPVN